MSEILDRIQADVTAILAETEGLDAAHHIRQDEHDLESRVRTKISTANPKSGKAGLVLLSLFPEVAETEQNLPGPPVRVRVVVQTIEHVITNRGAVGTGLRSSEAAIAALKTLHLRHFGDYLLIAQQNPIRSVQVPDGFVSHEVQLFARFELEVADKVAAIDASIASSLMTLTTATIGASIYYTTNGTFPTTTNGTLYSSPISVTAGQTFRAAAYKAGLLPSDAIELDITA